jgi:hypothetical protein
MEVKPFSKTESLLISCSLFFQLTYAFTFPSMSSYLLSYQAILDFDNELDVNLLDRVIDTFYTGAGTEVCQIYYTCIASMFFVNVVHGRTVNIYPPNTKVLFFPVV